MMLTYMSNHPITYRQFHQQPPHRQTELYFSHPHNQRTNQRGQPGPSAVAQAAWINDWRKAHNDFSETLP